MEAIDNNINPKDSTNNKQTEKEEIESLISDLANKDSITRIKARASLVSYGHRAVGPLLEALSSKNQWVRWETAKALSQIHDPASINGLVGALRDEMFDVRWLAAEGLIEIGRKSLIPLLQALVEHPNSVWIMEGVHHVLHDMEKGDLENILEPVLRGLEHIDGAIEVPFLAEASLNAIQKRKTG
jgi:HEAT repeat protein